MGIATVDIRERTSEQLPLWLEILNAASPPDSQATLEQAELMEKSDSPEPQPLRLMAWAGDQAVATGFAGHKIFEPQGRIQLTVRVRPEFRRRGIAKELYRRLETHAEQLGAQSITCRVNEESLPIVRHWLEREGYRQTERMRPSELRLENVDFEAWAEAERRVADSGIILTTLAEEDTEENRRKLWELYNRTHHDVPHDVVEDQPFDRFQQVTLDNPQCLRDCLVIAREGDRYAGFSIVGHERTGRVITWMTGVHPDYRNRGIALAVKIRSARLVRDRGYTAMRTANHVNNPPMLAVNTRLGYVPLPEVVTFVKTLATSSP